MSVIACRRSATCVVRLSLLLLLSSVCSLLRAQTIELKVINGRDGHPVVNTCVNAWVGDKQRDALAIPTDKDGIARLRMTSIDSEVNTRDHWKSCGEFGVINPVVKYEEFLSVNVSFVVCEPHGTNFSWLELKKVSTKEVLEKGFVTPNTCGKPAASPTPGRVSIFIRPLNFWEKLKQ